MFGVMLRADDWRATAACLRADPEMFFPLAWTGERNLALVAAAKALCARCSVRSQCLAYAREHEVTYGIWGGTTPADRVRARRRERRLARAAFADSAPPPAPERLSPWPDGGHGSRGRGAAGARQH